MEDLPDATGVAALAQTRPASLTSHDDPEGSADNSTPRHDVRVQLQYLKDDPLYDYEKPRQITPGFLDHDQRSNISLAPGEVETIQDIRGKESQFSLDANAFKYVVAPTTFTRWDSQPQIARSYLPELEELLKREVDGCDEIIFYDARIRTADEQGSRSGGLSYNPFARQVHTDNTETSVIAKIRDLTEIKADYLLRGRTRIVNVWRPIKYPVYDCALAVADGGGLREGDVIECDRHRQDTGQYWDTMGVVKYRPGFQWWYMFRQKPDEVLLFKNYDSDTLQPARYCLHTAFDMPEEQIPTDAPTRESIEVRALVFTYPPDVPHDARAPKPVHPLAIDLEKAQVQAADVELEIASSGRQTAQENFRLQLAAAESRLLAAITQVTSLETKLQEPEETQGPSRLRRSELVQGVRSISQELVQTQSAFHGVAEVVEAIGGMLSLRSGDSPPPRERVATAGGPTIAQTHRSSDSEHIPRL